MTTFQNQTMQTKSIDTTEATWIDQLGAVPQAPAMPCGVKNPLWFGFPERLVAIRLQADMSMPTLTSISRVTQSVIANSENRRTIPRISAVEKMAYALGVSPSWLAFGHDGSEPFAERIRRSYLRVPKDPRPSEPKPCPELYKLLPQRLREARERSGQSLRGLALACGLSGPGVAKIEMGVSVPTLDNIEAIAKALGVSPGWLAFGIGRGIDGKRYRSREAA